MKVLLTLWISAVLIQEVVPAALVRQPRHSTNTTSVVHTEYEAKYEQKGKHGNENLSTLSGKQQFVHENCSENWNAFADKCAALIKDLVSSLANVVSSKPGDATKLQLQIKNTFKHFDNTHNCSFLNGNLPCLFDNITINTAVANGSDGGHYGTPSKVSNNDDIIGSGHNSYTAPCKDGKEIVEDPSGLVYEIPKPNGLVDAKNLHPSNSDHFNGDPSSSIRRDVKYPQVSIQPGRAKEAFVDSGKTDPHSTTFGSDGKKCSEDTTASKHSDDNPFDGVEEATKHNKPKTDPGHTKETNGHTSKPGDINKQSVKPVIVLPIDSQTKDHNSVPKEGAKVAPVESGHTSKPFVVIPLENNNPSNVNPVINCSSNLPESSIPGSEDEKTINPSPINEHKPTDPSLNPSPHIVEKDKPSVEDHHPEPNNVHFVPEGQGKAPGIDNLHLDPKKPAEAVAIVIPTPHITDEKPSGCTEHTTPAVEVPTPVVGRSGIPAVIVPGDHGGSTIPAVIIPNGKTEPSGPSSVSGSTEPTTPAYEVPTIADKVSGTPAVIVPGDHEGSTIPAVILPNGKTKSECSSGSTEHTTHAVEVPTTADGVSGTPAVIIPGDHGGSTIPAVILPNGKTEPSGSSSVSGSTEHTTPAYEVPTTADKVSGTPAVIVPGDHGGSTIPAVIIPNGKTEPSGPSSFSGSTEHTTPAYEVPTTADGVSGIPAVIIPGDHGESTIPAVILPNGKTKSESPTEEIEGEERSGSTGPSGLSRLLGKITHKTGDGGDGGLESSGTVTPAEVDVSGDGQTGEMSHSEHGITPPFSMTTNSENGVTPSIMDLLKRTGTEDSGQAGDEEPTTFQTTAMDPTNPEQPHSTETTPSSAAQDSDETWKPAAPASGLVHPDDDDDDEDCCSCESCTEKEMPDVKYYRNTACRDLEEARRELKKIFDKITKKLKCGRKTPTTITARKHHHDNHHNDHHHNDHHHKDHHHNDHHQNDHHHNHHHHNHHHHKDHHHKDHHHKDDHHKDDHHKEDHHKDDHHKDHHDKDHHHKDHHHKDHHHNHHDHNSDKEA